MLTPDEPTFIRLIIDGPVTTTGDWGPYLNPTPSLNTVLQDADHPTKLVIGVMEDNQTGLETRACGDLANKPCRNTIAPVPEGSILITP